MFADYWKALVKEFPELEKEDQAFTLMSGRLRDMLKHVYLLGRDEAPMVELIRKLRAEIEDLRAEIEDLKITRRWIEQTIIEQIDRDFPKD